VSKTHNCQASSQLPKTALLKIDKDCMADGQWIKDYRRLIRTICKWFKVKVNRIRMCPSAHKGQHFRVDITPPISARLANRIQYLLGDDCQRVAFNQARIESGLVEWNKLFERSNVRLRTIYRGIKVPRGTKAGKNGR
jgi:hypothetical protein